MPQQEPQHDDEQDTERRRAAFRERAVPRAPHQRRAGQIGGIPVTRWTVPPQSR